MRKLIVQPFHQRFSQERLARPIDLGLVHTIDEIERGRVRIAPDHKIPALVADIDAESATFATKRTVAEIADA